MFFVKHPFGKFLLACLSCLFTFLSFGQYNPNNGFLDAHFGKPITFSSSDSSFSLGIGGRIQSLAEIRQDMVSDKIRLTFLSGGCGSIFPAMLLVKNLPTAYNFVFRSGMLRLIIPLFRTTYSYGMPCSIIPPINTGGLVLGKQNFRVTGNGKPPPATYNLPTGQNTNALFTLDRDKGFWIANTITTKGKAVISNTLAITSGEGRITSDKTNGLCYSARSEVLPFGVFKSNGDYIESDIYFEDKFKLSVGFSYSFNNRTSRVAGTLGEYLYNDQLADIHYYGTDIVMKKKGWSFTGEIYKRTSKNGVSINPSNSKVNFVYSGTGLLLQSGYLFTKKDEIAIRYGRTSPDTKVASYISTLNEYMMAYSHYFFRHNLKLQTDAGYFKGPGQELLQWRFTGIVTF